MAETDAVATPAKGAGAFLTKKVGPLPVWVWMAAAIAIYLYYSKQQAKAAPSSSSAPNLQTDPAGNVGTIDPQTGYVYGTPADNAALNAQNSGSSSIGGNSAGQNATTGGQTYADNNAWGRAAVSYLAGLGIDATTANEAVQQYLSSQVLTTAQQGDINLAIQALGPPPSLPGPTGVTPPPVSVPGSGGTTGTGGGGNTNPPPPATPTVTNGKVVSVSNNRAVISWKATGATQWRLHITGPGKINGHVSTVNTPTGTYGGLEAGHNYEVDIQPLVAGKPVGTPGRIDFKTTGGTPATTGKK